MLRVLWFIAFVGLASAASARDECEFLLWLGLSEPELEEHLQGRQGVSIFEVLSRAIDQSTEIWIEAAIAQRDYASYLVPPGSDAYARTSGNRIELRFRADAVDLPDLSSVGKDSVFLVAGRLEEENLQWVLADTIYISELVDRPNECVSDAYQ